MEKPRWLRCTAVTEVLTWGFRKSRTQNWKGHWSNYNLFSAYFNIKVFQFIELFRARPGRGTNPSTSPQMDHLCHCQKSPEKRVISDIYPAFRECRLYEEMQKELIPPLHEELWEISGVATNVDVHTLRHYILSENNRAINTLQFKYSYLQTNPL